MVHLVNEILFRAKRNEQSSQAKTWREFKWVLMSKRSQPENATYYMNPAKCHSEKGKIWLPIPVFLGFSGGSDSEESACYMGDLSLIPELGRSTCRRAQQPTPVFLPEKSPWTEEPGGLQSMGSQRVGHDW